MRHHHRKDLDLAEPSPGPTQHHAGDRHRQIGNTDTCQPRRIVRGRVGKGEHREHQQQQDRRPDAETGRQRQWRARHRHRQRRDKPAPGRHPAPEIKQESLHHRRGHPEDNPEPQHKRVFKRVARAEESTRQKPAEQQEEYKAGDVANQQRRCNRSEIATWQQPRRRPVRQKPQKQDAERDNDHADRHIGACRQQRDKALTGCMRCGRHRRKAGHRQADPCTDHHNTPRHRPIF